MDTLVLRVAARYARQISSNVDVQALTFPREFHLPEHVRPTPAHVPEGTDLAVWTWESPVGPQQIMGYFFVIFAGKSNKPVVGPFWSKTPAARQHTIDETVKSRRAIIEMKTKRMEEKKNFVHGLQKGEIFVSSWGYDQTNVDFFKIVDVRGKEVVAVEIGSKIVSSGHGSDSVVADPDRIIGQTFRARPSQSGSSVSFKVGDHYAHKWDGRPQHQTAAGYGH